jgi:hypothetical protein
MKILLILGLALSLAGCGTYGIGANTPIGGAGVGVTVGAPGPSYLR